MVDWAGRSMATYCIPATKVPAIAKQTMKSTSRASGDRVECCGDIWPYPCENVANPLFGAKGIYSLRKWVFTLGFFPGATLPAAFIYPCR